MGGKRESDGSPDDTLEYMARTSERRRADRALDRRSSTDLAMIWRGYWVFGPWIGAALVLILTTFIAGIIGYGRPLTGVPAYDLDTLFPRLVAAKRETPARTTEQVATSDAKPRSRFSQRIDEERAAATWALAALALALALSVSLFVPWVLAYQSLKPVTKRRGALFWFVLIAACLLGFLIWRRQAAILPDILQVLVDHLGRSENCEGIVCNPVKAYREVTKGLSVVAIIGLVFSCSVTLRVGTRKLEYLAQQTHRLRIGMFVAATLLVAGVMEVSLLLHWPPARLSPEDAAAIVALADTVSIGNGTVLSLLLVSTYGLASLILFARVRERALEIEPDKAKRDDWLADHGLASLPAQQVLRVLTLLAPLIAGGPLTSLLASLGH